MATYTSPARGRITSRYMDGRTHAGTDIAPPTPGQTGQPVAAFTAGMVQQTGVSILPGRTGNGVLLAHPDGTKTYYGHLDSFYVRAGQSVSTGQTIGIMGATGNVTGIHVHFEIHVGGQTVNPEPYAAARGVTLGNPITPDPAGAYPPGYPTVHVVRDIQEHLTAMGIYTGPIDEINGPETRAAIRRWMNNAATDLAAVMHLQLHLNNNSGTRLILDGIFGMYTNQAVCDARHAGVL